MLEVLQVIPERQFLLLYPLMALTAIAVGRLYIGVTPSGTLPSAPANLTPFLIAVLHGEWERMLKTVIFTLWQRGVLELTGGNATSGEPLRLRRAASATVPLDPVEMTVWQFLATDRQPDDVLTDNKLRSAIEKHVSHVLEGFENQTLIRPPSQRRRAYLATALVSIAVMGTGLTRLVLGGLGESPSVMLPVMLFCVFVAILITLKPGEQLTPAGIRLLKQLEGRYDGLKDGLKGPIKPGIDMAYAVAVFGTEALADSRDYAIFCLAFPPRKTPASSYLHDDMNGCYGGGGG